MMLRLPLLVLISAITLSFLFGPALWVIGLCVALTLLSALPARGLFRFLGLPAAALGLLIGGLARSSSAADASAWPGSGFRESVFIASGFADPLPGGRWKIEARGDVRLQGGVELSAIGPGDRFTVRGYGSSSEWMGREWRNFRVTEFLSSAEAIPSFRWAASMRKASAGRIETLEEPGQRALLHALILGNTAFMDYGVKESFRLTGITHLLAISGLNVAIAGAAFFLLFRRFLGERKALLLSCAAAFLCVTAAGFSPSASRAGAMYILGALLKASGRLPDAADVLLVTGAAALSFFPVQAAEIGFWLSYLAVGGLIFLTKPCARPLEILRDRSSTDSLPGLPRKAYDGVNGLLSTSLAASLSTLPLLLYCFGGVSVLSLLANLAVIPVFHILTLSVYAHFALLWTGLPWLSVPLGYFENALWGFTKAVADFLSLAPWGYMKTGSFGIPALAGTYALLIAFFAFLPRLVSARRKRKTLWKPETAQTQE